MWGGKKTAVVTASPGGYGGIKSDLHLRQSRQSLGADVLIFPEVFLSKANAALDQNDSVADERTQSFLNKFAAVFYAWAGK